MSCLSIFCITLKKGFNMVFPGDSDDKIQIELSAPQWELLSASRREMDESLARCVSVALKSGDMYQLYLSLDELDELLMFVEDQAEEENNKKKRQMWADLADYLDDVGEQESEGGFWGPGPIENLSEMTGSVYVFKVALADDASIWRRIALRGGQTLHDLQWPSLMLSTAKRPICTRSISRSRQEPQRQHIQGFRIHALRFGGIGGGRNDRDVQHFFGPLVSNHRRRPHQAPVANWCPNSACCICLTSATSGCTGLPLNRPTASRTMATIPAFSNAKANRRPNTAITIGRMTTTKTGMKTNNARKLQEDYRSFSVARAMTAKAIDNSQNRTTTCGSDQPAR